MSSLLQSSTLGDRKEIWGMLHRLPPLDRLRFLCEYVATIDRHGKSMASARNMPIREAYRCDEADVRVTNAIYLDIILFASDCKANLDAAVNGAGWCGGGGVRADETELSHRPFRARPFGPRPPPQ